MESRRTFLKGGIAIAGASLAGCTVENIPGVGDEGSGTAAQYDAAAMFDAETAVVGSADVGAALDAPIPETLRNEIDRLDTSVESVDAADVDSLDVSAFFDFDERRMGYTAFLWGEFDREDLREELLDPERIVEIGTHRGTERYASSSEAFALTDGGVVFGAGDGDVEPVELVDAGLDALADEAPAFADRENGATLQSALDGDVTVAADLGSGLREELRSDFEEGPFGTMADATTAVGVDATFDGDTTDLGYVFVPDGETLDAETVRSFAEEVENVEESTLRGVSVSDDGRAILASARADTDHVVESQLQVLTAQYRSQRNSQRTAPNVQLSVERTDDNRARVTHQGGDGVDSLEVHYEGPDRIHQETWTEPTITAGDSFVSDHEVADEGHVRVVWKSQDGAQSTTLAAATL